MSEFNLTTKIDTLTGYKTEYRIIDSQGALKKHATYDSNGQILLVYDRSEKSVEAKFLTDVKGSYIIDPSTNKPYIVPKNYSVDNAVNDVQSTIDTYFVGNNFPSFVTQFASNVKMLWDISSLFKSGAKHDIQRTYNNVVGGGGDQFVPAFTSAASFHFAYALKANGYSENFTKFSGGFYNKLSSLSNPNISMDTSGDYYNNPHNLNDMNKAFDVFNKGLLNHKPSISKMDSDGAFLDLDAHGNDAIIITMGSNRHIEFFTNDKTKQNNIISEYAFPQTASTDGFIPKGYNLTSSYQNGELTRYHNDWFLNGLKNTTENITLNNNGIITDIKDSIIKIGDDIYYDIKDTAEVTIDGVTHTAGAIVEAGEIAYDALSDFLKGNYQNNIISNALSSALNNTFADIAGIIAGGGTVDSTKILTTFAKRTGYAFIASSFTQTTAVRELTVHLNGGEVQTINNTSYIKTKSGGNIATNAEQKVDAKGNVYYEGKNSNGQTVTATEAELSLGGTGKAAISGLLNFGIQAAFEGQNWNSNDYLENGTITIQPSRYANDNLVSRTAYQGVA